jgi:5'-3' exonuclease
MGIPSFYKHLLQTVGGLTSAKRTPPQVFALDLNCAIYHCMRKVPTPYSHATRVSWEDTLIQHVLTYIKHMTRIVGPTKTLYIAVDGVAPMAKIKQQRARRFKSAVLAVEEAQVKAEARREAYVPTERWDSNAITPGTEFMRRLAIALRGLNVSGVEVVVSPADEAGEGEQKIMAWIRGRPEVHDIVVYGLDADLIVLALLEHGRSGRTVDLFREETEFNGAVKSNAVGEEQYLYLLTSHLATTLHKTWRPSQTREQFLMDFVGVMNLLGNDFLPHGMGLKIHDEGIEHVLGELKRQDVGPLVVGNAYNVAVLAPLFEELGKAEERWMLRTVRKKLDARPGATQSKDVEQQAMVRLNDRPLEWQAERVLVEQVHVEGQEKPQWRFRPDWRSMYYQFGVWDSGPEDVMQAYCKTMTWTLRYYLGEPVDMCWYYPWFLPPLLSDLARSLSRSPHLLDTPASRGIVLRPLEQLAMVLPASSFHLLPKDYQVLPNKYPYAWPTSWSLFSMGRRFLWECEPLIPLIQPAQMRDWVEDLD